MQTQAKKTRSFEAWIEALPSQGRYSFTRSEAMEQLGLQRKAFNRVSGRLSAANRLARIRGEFYVVVPLEQAAAGGFALGIPLQLAGGVAQPLVAQPDRP